MNNRLLSALNRVMPKKTYQPVLQQIKIANNALSLTNLDSWLTVWLDSSFAKINCLVDARQFLSLIKTGNYKVNQDNCSERLLLTNSTMQTSLEIKHDINDYPLSPVEKISELMLVRSECLITALKQTMFCAASFDTGSVIGGVHFSLNRVASKLRLTSTDGNRLSDINIGAIEFNNTPLPEKLDFILPVDACKTLLDCLHGTKHNVTIGHNNNYAVISNADFELKSRTISGQYPAVDELIPDHHASFAVVKNQLIDAIKAIKLTYTKEDKRHFVNVSVNGNLSLSHKENASKCDLISKASNFDFAVDINYLLEAIQSINDTAVIVSHDTPLKPLVLTSGDYRHLLMPVELPKQ